jgi:hypothetical protein
MFRQRPARAVLLGLLPLLGCLALGCGSKGYRVSGKVTFKGQPIPAGKIYFIPDTKNGNKGATGYADIKDGAYDTSVVGGFGTVGGPMLIKIEGFEPLPADKVDKSKEVTSKALFPTYQTTADLPKGDSTKDFDVPAEAPKPAQPKGGVIIP